MHSEILIWCNPFFVQIASNSFPASGSASYAFVGSFEIEGRHWTGGMCDNKRNCSGRFCPYRTTFSIVVILSSSPSGGSPGLLVRASPFSFDGPGRWIIWYSNLVKSSYQRACGRFKTFCPIKFSRFLRSVIILRGYAALSHLVLHSSSASMIAISSVSYLSWSHSAGECFCTRYASQGNTPLWSYQVTTPADT